MHGCGRRRRRHPPRARGRLAALHQGRRSRCQRPCRLRRRDHARPLAAGVTWGEFDAATQAHGLATTGGRITTTGIAGLTLGAGSGWLERMFGYTSHNLLAAEIVTADGRMVRASEDENADLLWGLRGGGGNFGVVTQFEYRLHEVGPMVTGGMVLWPLEQAGEVVRFYRDWIEAAPDDVGGGAAVVVAPPEEFVPGPLQGKPAIAVIPISFGDPELLRPIREFGSPFADLVGPMPYVAVQQLLDPGNPPGNLNYWKAPLARRRDRLAIQRLLVPAAGRCAGADPGGRCGNQPGAWKLGGACDRRVGDGGRIRTRARLGTAVGRAHGAVHACRCAAHLQRRHGRRACARDVRAGEVRAPGRPEGQVRPGQRLLPEPEHQAELGSGLAWPGRATTQSSIASVS
ncbi:MAG: FAD-dependent oxidoreductase [Actinobacteria bacterium]|nr:MAG: FAD-dependent oxidoreductase [Actinomycetota bacterium]